MSDDVSTAIQLYTATIARAILRKSLNSTIHLFRMSKSCKCRSPNNDFRMNHLISPEGRRSFQNRLKRSSQKIFVNLRPPQLQNDEFLVNCIICHKWVANRPWFYIKWQGYEKATWEPCCHISKGILSAYARSKQTTNMEFRFYMKHFNYQFHH